jgi:hypothetical protein
MILEIAPSRFDSRGHTDMLTSEPMKVTRYELRGVPQYMVLESFPCGGCGVSAFWKPLDYDASPEDVKFVASTDCAVSAIKPFTTQISVPSGQLVFADSLWRYGLEPPTQPARFSMNSVVGRIGYSILCEASGIAFGSILDCDPTVLINDLTGAITLARLESDGEDDWVTPAGLRNLGSICTDLWAYSLMDYELYLSSGGRPDEALTVASVRPGLYTFTHYSEADGFDLSGDDFVPVAEATWSPLS